MRPSTIFISYNPKSEDEQILAVRLHTIGAVHGFRMFLPDRYNSETILDFETKRRIQESEWFVIFSTTKLSRIVKEEIEYAYEILKDKSRIIVIYDSTKGRNIVGIEHCTEIYFDSKKESIDQVIKEKILVKIFQDLNQEHTRLKVKNDEKNAILAFLGIGLGLAMLSSLSAEK